MGRLSLRLPGAGGLFVGSALLAALARAVRVEDDPDYFWHVVVGRWIIDHRAIPASDLFTYTVAGHRFVAHEWLSEVGMAALSAGLGTWAVSLAFGLVTWAGFWLLLGTMREAGWFFRAWALLLGLWAVLPVLGPRTQMLTFALSALVLWLLRRWREDGRTGRLWILPPLFAVWANLHAGFTFGLGLLAVYLVGEALLPAARRQPLRPLALALVACVAACAVNPNLAAIYPYALATQASPVQQQLIVEWASPDFHLLEIRGFEAMLLLLPALLALALRHGRPIRPVDLLLLLVGVALALQSQRHIALFVVLAVPVLAEVAQAAWDSRPFAYNPRTPSGGAFGVVNLAALGLLALLLGAYVVGGLRQEPARIRQAYPVAALDWAVANRPPGPMLDLYDWGGYCVYRLWPARQVFVYGDAAVMGDDFLRRYEAIAYLHPDWRQTLDAYGVEWVVFGSDRPLTTVLAASPDWVVAHRDPVATVLVRRDTGTAAWLAAHGG